jgi:hypothetical protein
VYTGIAGGNVSAGCAVVDITDGKWKPGKLWIRGLRALRGASELAASLSDSFLKHHAICAHAMQTSCMLTCGFLDQFLLEGILSKTTGSLFPF